MWQGSLWRHHSPTSQVIGISWVIWGLTQEMCNGSQTPWISYWQQSLCQHQFLCWLIPWQCPPSVDAEICSRFCYQYTYLACLFFSWYMQNSRFQRNNLGSEWNFLPFIYPAIIRNSYTQEPWNRNRSGTHRGKSKKQGITVKQIINPAQHVMPGNEGSPHFLSDKQLRRDTKVHRHFNMVSHLPTTSSKKHSPCWYGESLQQDYTSCLCLRNTSCALLSKRLSDTDKVIDINTTQLHLDVDTPHAGKKMNEQNLGDVEIGLWFSFEKISGVCFQ